MWLLKNAANTAVTSGVDAFVRTGVTRAIMGKPSPSTINTTIVNQYDNSSHNHTYQTDTKDKQIENEKDFCSCLDLFNEGMEMLLASLDRSQGVENMYRVSYHGMSEVSNLEYMVEANILKALNRDIFSADVDELKTVSKGRLEWAKSSFKSASVGATRAFNNKALDEDRRLLAAKITLNSSRSFVANVTSLYGGLCKLPKMPVDAIIKLVSTSIGLVSNVAKLKGAHDAAKANKSRVRDTTIVAIPYQIDTADKRLRMLINEKDLRSCISLFNEGLGMLMVALNRIRERPESCDRMAREENVLDLGAVVCDVFSEVLDELKTVSKESFEWAKSSFKSAREDATRAYVNEALNTEKRLLAAMVSELTISQSSRELGRVANHKVSMVYGLFGGTGNISLKSFVPPNSP